MAIIHHTPPARPFAPASHNTSTTQQTEKGYGYPPAEAASDKYHGVAKFDVSTGRQFKGGAKGAYHVIFTCVGGVFGPQPTYLPTYRSTIDTDNDINTHHTAGGPPSLTTTFANALCEIAAEDRTVVGITAAMPGGTGKRLSLVRRMHVYI